MRAEVHDRDALDQMHPLEVGLPLETSNLEEEDRNTMEVRILDSILVGDLVVIQILVTNIPAINILEVRTREVTNTPPEVNNPRAMTLPRRRHHRHHPRLLHSRLHLHLRLDLTPLLHLMLKPLRLMKKTIANGI